MLAAETLDYGKEALGYYLKCVSLLPHLAGLTAPDLKQAKVPRPPPTRGPRLTSREQQG